MTFLFFSYVQFIERVNLVFSTIRRIVIFEICWTFRGTFVIVFSNSLNTRISVSLEHKQSKAAEAFE